MPTYLVRLAQAHESFRKVELQALADLANVHLEFVKYEEDVRHPVYRCHASILYLVVQIISLLNAVRPSVFLQSNIPSPHTAS
jgi:tRNA G10  N-methylase Trm11